MDAVQQINVREGLAKKEIKNMAIYSAARTVSVFGTAIYNFAIGLYVLKLTGSALSFAVTLMLGVIPMIIINPLAGVIADKVNKKTLLVSMDVLSGILLAGVYIISMKFELNLALIYSTTFILTVFSCFFGIGAEAAKPNLVSGKMLMNINSVSKIIDSISSILGPMLGGLVFAVLDIRTFILINAVSFILSGLSLLFIDFRAYSQRQQETYTGEKIQFIRDIKEGFQYLFDNKSLKGLFTILISINFFLGFAVTVPLPYIINTILKLSSKELGIVEGTFAVGMIAGALFIKKVTERLSYSAILNAVCLTMALLMAMIGLPVIANGLHLEMFSFTYYFIIIMFLFGMSIAFVDIPLAYFMQKEIPEEYRGRVLSIGISMGKIMLPIAMVTSGVLLSQLPAYVMPIAGGVLFYLFTIRSSAKLKFEINA